jgi:hypothetical protein
MMRCLILVLLGLAVPLSAAPRPLPFRLVETGQGYARLADAVAAIGTGTGTILIAPGVYRECAVQQAGAIIYRAQEPGRVVLDGVACEGKAGLVLRGRAAAIDGLVFRNFRVADRNGAGIRRERGDLHVTNSSFRQSEQGILTHDDRHATLRIERSTFSGLGGCPNGVCSHSIYAGNYGQVIIRRCRFEQGTGGHYVKSRSARIEVTDSSFDDSHGRATNYMIDLPAGATGLIAGNDFVQGPDKENYSAFIAIGAEQRLHSAAGLQIAGNHAALAPGVRRTSSFIANWTRDPIRITDNQLGPGLRPYAAR